MITITNTADNSYTVTNNNAYSIYLVIDVLNTNSAFELYSNSEIIPIGESLTFSLPDGYYIVKEYRSSNNALILNYLIPVYVSIQNSLNSISRELVKELSCNSNPDCNCEALFPSSLYLQHCYLMAIHLSYSYFSLINKIMIDNYVFSFLDTELSSDLITLNTWKLSIDRYFELINQHYGVS